MSRPVGGASAVGCGVFGFLSLIIGVGLVVWLSSMTLDGSSSSDDDASPSTTRPASVVDLATTGAKVAVAAPADLADGGAITVTGTGLPAGPASVSIEVCLAHPPAGDGCDPASGSSAAIGAEGGLTTQRTVDRVITVDDVAYDCAAAASVCVVRVRMAGDTSGPGVTAAFSFAAGLPPVDAEAPPTS